MWYLSLPQDIWSWVKFKGQIKVIEPPVVCISYTMHACLLLWLEFILNACDEQKQTKSKTHHKELSWRTLFIYKVYITDNKYKHFYICMYIHTLLTNNTGRSDSHTYSAWKWDLLQYTVLREYFTANIFNKFVLVEILRVFHFTSLMWSYFHVYYSIAEDSIVLYNIYKLQHYTII